MPMTFEEELRSALDRLGDYAPSGPVPNLAVQARVLEKRRRFVVTVAVVASAALVAAGVWALQRHPRAPTVVATGPGAVSALPSAPISGRSDMASAWTGQQWLIWGGSNARGWLADGAAFDPATDRWSPLPPAPLQARIDPVSVWTGHLWLIWGGTSSTYSFRDGASYDPATRTWQPMPAAPADLPSDGSIMPEGVWTGTELIIVTSTGHAAAYQPSTQRWLRVADPPGVAADPEPHAVWTGSAAVFLLGDQGGVGEGLNGFPAPSPTSSVGKAIGATIPPGTVPVTGEPPSRAGYHLASYDPKTDHWSELPLGGLQPNTEPDLVWTGSLLLTLNPTVSQVGYQSNYPEPGYHQVTTPAGINAAYDPATREWSLLPAIPSSLNDPGPLSSLASAPPVWTGTSVLLWAGGKRGLSYTPRTASWSEFPTGGGPARQRQATAWTGSDLLGWGGSNVADAAQVLNTGVRYYPAS